MAFRGLEARGLAVRGVKGRVRGVRLPGGAPRFSSWLAGGRLLP